MDPILSPFVVVVAVTELHVIDCSCTNAYACQQGALVVRSSLPLAVSVQLARYMGSTTMTTTHYQYRVIEFDEPEGS